MNTKLETVEDIRTCQVVPLLSAKYAELKRRIHLDIKLLAACGTRLITLGFKLDEDPDIIERWKLIDTGKMSPTTYFKLLPVPKVTTLIGNMPVHEQEEIANGRPVPVAVPGDDGKPIIIKEKIFDMSAQEKAVAFVDGRPRRKEDMIRIVKMRMQQKEIPPYRIAINPPRLIVHKTGEYDLDKIIKEYAASKKSSSRKRTPALT